MSRLFYGWRIVGVAALAQTVSVGTTFYAYGVFVKPLIAEFDVSRLAVTMGLTLTMIVQGLIAPFLGRALDRHSPRTILVCGVLLEAVGMLLLARAAAFWQLGLLFVGAIGIGSYLFSPLATSAVVGRWFDRQRGRALGITALGSAAGGIFAPPLVTAAIAALGWRGAAGAMGGVLLLLVAPIALVVVRQPEDLGLTPDGDARAPRPRPIADVSSAVATPAPTTAALLRQRNFWAITIAIGLTYSPVSVLLAHLVPYGTDLGLEPARAAIVMSGFGFGAAAGRLPFGWLADRVDRRIAVWIMLGWMALAFWSLLGEPAFPRLLAAATAVGFAVGGTIPLWGALAGAAFGRHAIGSAMGLMNLLMLPFSISGAPLAAWVFDRTGSYAIAFASFLACFPLGAVAIAFLRIDARDPQGVSSDGALDDTASSVRLEGADGGPG
ncbi:MAG: MFS transporter [Myxococcota bacterium]